MSEEEAEVKQQKFVAIVDDQDKGIVFQVVGLTMDEAMLLVAKGYVKFQKRYENYLRNQE